jgi:hypothetical protein
MSPNQWQSNHICRNHSPISEIFFYNLLIFIIALYIKTFSPYQYVFLIHHNITISILKKAKSGNPYMKINDFWSEFSHSALIFPAKDFKF